MRLRGGVSRLRRAEPHGRPKRTRAGRQLGAGHDRPAFVQSPEHMGHRAAEPVDRVEDGLTRLPALGRARYAQPVLAHVRRGLRLASGDSNGAPPSKCPQQVALEALPVAARDGDAHDRARVVADDASVAGRPQPFARSVSARGAAAAERIPEVAAAGLHPRVGQDLPGERGGRRGVVVAVQRVAKKTVAGTSLVASSPRA